MLSQYYFYYSVTTTPIDLAVPSTILIAVSSDAAFKSGIFCSAIALTCSLVILATFSLFGFPDPFSILIDFLIKTATGGTLVINSKDLSLYIMSQKTTDKKITAMFDSTTSIEKAKNMKYSPAELEKLEKQLDEQIKIGMNLNVQGTPTIFDKDGKNII